MKEEISELKKNIAEQKEEIISELKKNIESGEKRMTE